MSRLALHLFGSPRLLVQGAPVEVDTRKAIALLAYLAVSRETHQRDSLAALLWPDYDQTSARAALRRTLSTLNRAIEDERGETALEITRESLALKPSADLWMDVQAFRQAAAESSQHGHAANAVCARCLESLKRAAGLHPEPFMAGFNLRDSPNFEEWQFFQAETLQRELSIVLEKLVRGLSARDQVEEAVSHARRWLALDPLREEAHRQLMILYAQADQRNAALRQYRECVRILDQELGVAPLEETTRLYEAILNRGPLPETNEPLRFIEIEPLSSAVPPPPSEAAQAPAGVPAGIPAVEPAAANLVQSSPLIGRESEWQLLRKTYADTGGGGRLAALIGEAGIGKTHLAECFLSTVRQGGARIIQARCYAGETGLAYAPLIDGIGAALSQPEMLGRIRHLPAAALADAGRLFPAIRALENVPASETVDGDGLQARFFESLRQVIQALLEGESPGVLFIDDLHWADTATLDLLTFLSRRLKGTRLFLLATWRADSSEAVLRLERLAGELARENTAITLRLNRLDPEAMVALVRAYPGAADRAETLGKRLYAESEGLPFIAVEYLSALAQHEGGLPLDSWDMPSGVRDLLRSRLGGLDAAALQLLSTAAVIGRSFDFSILREVSGRSEIETVDGLENLLAAGLVVEQAEGESAGREIRYDFTHEKLRALIYEDTSQTRRRLLHRRVADTLARLHPQRVGQPGLVAYHYEQAGQNPEAAEFHLLAGEQARALFANTEALAHFQSALAAGHPDAAGIHEAIGDLYTLQGDYAGAISSFQTAAALCSPGCLANLEHKLGNVQQRMGNWDLAESHYQASLEAAGQDPNALPADHPGPAENAYDLSFQVHLYADRSLVAHAQGDAEKAQALALRSQALAQSAGDPHAMAQACNILGVLARARGELDQAAAYLEESLRSAGSLNDPLARIAALNNLALVYGEQGRLEQAIQMAEQALALCQKRGDRHREAALHNNLADLLHQAGRAEEAMNQLKQAVVIFAEIGEESEAVVPGQSGAEVWKLTEW